MEPDPEIVTEREEEEPGYDAWQEHLENNQSCQIQSPRNQQQAQTRYHDQKSWGQKPAKKLNDVGLFNQELRRAAVFQEMMIDTASCLEE